MVSVWRNLFVLCLWFCAPLVAMACDCSCHKDPKVVNTGGYCKVAWWRWNVQPWSTDRCPQTSSQAWGTQTCHIESSGGCCNRGCCPPPTASPTIMPSAAPTLAPTALPTSAPTASPTMMPSASPTPAPTALPTSAPAVACDCSCHKDPRVFNTGGYCKVAWWRWNVQPWSTDRCPQTSSQAWGTQTCHIESSGGCCNRGCCPPAPDTNADSVTDFDTLTEPAPDTNADSVTDFDTLTELEVSRSFCS